MASTKATELAQLSRKLTYNEGTDVAAIDGDGNFLTTGDTTDDLTEGSSNLYYTNTRSRTAISVSGSLSYDSGTGVISYTTPGLSGISGTTDDLTEGTTNLFFTDERVQNVHYYVKASSAIAKGEVVMFTGAQGDHILAAPADHSASGFLPEHVMGVASTTMATNDFGYVVSFGTVTGIDTSSFSLGDLLYSDPSNAGEFTTTEPTPTDHIILVAAVTNSHATQGTVQIRLTHKPDTDEVPEGASNLYYTDARAQAAITGGTGVTVSSGQVSIDQSVATTANVTFNDIHADGDVTIDGDLTVSGTTVTINATNLSIEDNMIYLNDGSTVANPDLGIAGNYNDGTYAHAGVFRDATDGRWKFFDSYTPEPDASAYINTGHASFALADVQADTFIGALTGNVTGTVSDVSNHDTDDISEGSSNLYYTDARVDARITQTAINNLNVDADTVDGKHYDDIISEATALAIALG